MTNKTKKGQHDKYKDPFELHRLQSEANIKKMKMEKRLNVFNGNAINSGSTPITLQLLDIFRKRHALSDKTNTSCLNENIKNRKEVSKPKVTISGMRSTIIAMHRKPSTKKLGIMKPSTNQSNKISIFALSSIIKSTKFTSHTKNSSNNRLFEISRDIILYIPFERINTSKESILSQVHLYVKSFIEWFIINKFDYILVDKNLKALSANSETERLCTIIPEKQASVVAKQGKGMVEQISKQRYIRNHHQKIVNLCPTHIVQKCKNIGKYITTANVKDINTNKESVILLLRTDIRFKVKPNDILVLADKSHTTQSIDNKEVSIYMNWQVYKEKPLDISFF